MITNTEYLQAVVEAQQSLGYDALTEYKVEYIPTLYIYVLFYRFKASSSRWHAYALTDGVESSTALIRLLIEQER